MLGIFKAGLVFLAKRLLKALGKVAYEMIVAATSEKVISKLAFFILSRLAKSWKNPLKPGLVALINDVFEGKEKWEVPEKESEVDESEPSADYVKDDVKPRPRPEFKAVDLG